MRFVIIDTAQYHGDSKISPEYIDKLKDKYKLKTIKVKKYNKEVEYTIVGSTEVNLAENKISNESPIGKALLGAKKEATVEVNAPAGKIKYEIRKITK